MPDDYENFTEGIQYPHCDSRICHKPKTCKYCDMHPDLQQQRITEGVNFTGEFYPDLLPCPADAERPPGADNDHRRWYGNVRKAYDDI